MKSWLREAVDSHVMVDVFLQRVRKTLSQYKERVIAHGRRSPRHCELSVHRSGTVDVCWTQERIIEQLVNYVEQPGGKSRGRIDVWRCLHVACESSKDSPRNVNNGSFLIYYTREQWTNVQFIRKCCDWTWSTFLLCTNLNFCCWLGTADTFWFYQFFSKRICISMWNFDFEWCILLNLDWNDKTKVPLVVIS